MILYILGAGQYGQVAKEVAEKMGCYDQCLFLDDNSPLAFGKLADIEKYPQAHAFVAIGNPELRKQWYGKVRNPATLIHPRAIVMPSAVVGQGSILEAGAVICSNAKIGAGCILMSNCVVGHDACVGEFCQLKYGCVIPERCSVPQGIKVDCNVVFTEGKG